MISSDLQFQIHSKVFINGEVIPSKYTCEGNNVSPPLSWKNAPPGTKSFVIIVDDPDAPDPENPQRTWTHWIVYDLPAELDSLNEGAHNLPRQSKTALNDWKKTEYGGPCPPIGRHRYFFKIYALDIPKLELARPTRALIEDAMKGHILQKAELVGTYIKTKKSSTSVQTSIF